VVPRRRSTAGLSFRDRPDRPAQRPRHPLKPRGGPPQPDPQRHGGGRRHPFTESSTLHSHSLRVGVHRFEPRPRAPPAPPNAMSIRSLSWEYTRRHRWERSAGYNPQLCKIKSVVPGHRRVRGCIRPSCGCGSRHGPSSCRAWHSTLRSAPS
jgi:hypothetical protein